MAVQKGNKGPNVQTVQMQLNKFGYGLTTDGIFGSGTEAAVSDFQSKHGLPATGIVDDATEETLAQGIYAMSQGTTITVPSAGAGIESYLPAALVRQGFTGYKVWQEWLAVMGIVGLMMYMRR